MIRVVSLPTNTKGRDFIFGDIHGHYDVLMSLLNQHRFDRTTDRAISTGDVIDRGPQSWRCLQLFQEPWFFGVRGNHEQHLLGLAALAREALAGRIELESITDAIREIGSGMKADWFADWLSVENNHPDLDALISRLQSIPHVLAVRGEGFNFNVVHAELAQAGICSDADLQELDGQVDETIQEALMWSQDLLEASAQFTANSTNQVRYDSQSGLSLTFCGHNVVTTPLIYKNHMFIDTGCGFSLHEFQTRSAEPGLTACIVPNFEIAFTPSTQAANINRQGVTDLAFAA